MSVGVLLVDDHPVVLEGLQRALESVEGIEVVGIAMSLAEACAQIEREDVDVALIDLRLPDGVGTTLISAAAARGHPATLVLSSFDHATYVAATVRLGAQGFLLKTAPMSEVVAAIRCVAAGGTAFSAAHLREARQPAITLSERERSILVLVIASRSNDEIAAELGVSAKTVEAKLTRLFERYGALSRTELAVRAQREGWLDLQ